MLPLILLLLSLEPSPFDNYRCDTQWRGPNAPIRITTPAEREYRTRLTQASQGKPNFACHYHFAIWGCGSNCAAGAIIDLKTGKIHPPPIKPPAKVNASWMFAGAISDGPAIHFRPDSRLVEVRSYDSSQQKNRTLLYEWTNDSFRPLK